MVVADTVIVLAVFQNEYQKLFTSRDYKILTQQWCMDIYTELLQHYIRHKIPTRSADNGMKQSGYKLWNTLWMEHHFHYH